MSKFLNGFQKMIFILVEWVEIIIASLIMTGVILHLCNIHVLWTFFQVEDLIGFLKYMFDALIGIELIKLVCKNDLFSMVEVLLFAVTRYLVIYHSSAVDLVLGVAAIGILFAVRKYLFAEQGTWKMTVGRHQEESHSEESEKR